MLAAISYARRSSEKRDNYSLVNQSDVNAAFAERAELRIIETVREDITGTIHLRDRRHKNDRQKRDETRLHGADAWALIAAKKARAIIVHRLDRLSRAETIDALALIRDILKHGCKIYISSTGVEIKDQNDIATIIEAWKDNRDKEDTVKKLLDGRLGKAKTKWVGMGRVPYGYNKVGAGKEARLEIDKPKAKIVKVVYTQYANGAAPSLHALVEWLNEKRIPASRGGIWYRSSLREILTNKTYAGYVTYMGVEAALNKQIAIIPLATWQQVQDRLIANRENSPRNTRGQYLMRGRVTCWCGRRMSVKVNNGRKPDAIWTRYRCNGAASPSSEYCGGIVSSARIDAIATEYMQWALTDEVLRDGIAELERNEAEQIAGRGVVDIDADISKAQATLKRFYVAFGDSGDDDDMRAIYDAKARIAELKAERDKLINAAANQQARHEVRESIAQHVKRLRHVLDTPTFLLLSELVTILDVQIALHRDNAGRYAALSCSIAPGRSFRLD